MALVCPSFTRDFAAKLAADLGLEGPVVEYPGLGGGGGGGGAGAGAGPGFTLAAAEDAIVRAADAARKEDAARARPHVGFGYSLGATLLVRAAARGTPFDALVLVSPVASFRRRAQEAGKLWRPWWQDRADAHGFDANHVLKELRELPADQEAEALAPDVGCPVLVLHGMRDVDVPMSHGRALADALPDAVFASVPTDHFWKDGRGASGRVMLFLAGLEPD